MVLSWQCESTIKSGNNSTVTIDYSQHNEKITTKEGNECVLMTGWALIRSEKCMVKVS